VGGVRALRLRQLTVARDSKATGWNAPESSGCFRMADTASSDASVRRRRVGRAGSHTQSTGAVVRAAALSASKLCCSPRELGPRAAQGREPERGVEGEEAQHELTVAVGEADETTYVGAHIKSDDMPCRPKAPTRKSYWPPGTRKDVLNWSSGRI
jgi:hypothetical protein